MNKYEELLGFNLNDYAKTDLELKRFFMNYKTSNLSNEMKSKLELMLEIAKDINTIAIDSRKEKIRSTEQVARYLQNKLAFSPIEKYGVMYLDKNFNLLDTRIEFSGGIDSSLVMPRGIAKSCLELEDVHYIVTAHNHPSGGTDASAADNSMHDRMNEAMKLIGVKYLEDIVVSASGYKVITNSVDMDYFVRWDEAFKNNFRANEPIKENKALSKNSINTLVKRGSIETLNLEEKICAITQLNPPKIKGLFSDKNIDELEIGRAGWSLLKSIESFSKRVERLLETNTNTNQVKVVKPELMAGAGEKIVTQNTESMAIVYLSTQFHVLNVKEFTYSTQEDEFVKEIIKGAIKCNAVSVGIVDNYKNGNIRDFEHARELFGFLKNRCGPMKIAVLDYIRIGENKFYSANGEYEGPYVSSLNSNQATKERVEERKMIRNNNIHKSIEMEI